MMRSGRTGVGLSEYTTQRLAELQAFREASEDQDSQTERKPHYALTSVRDEGLGSSRSVSSSSEGVTSPRSPQVSSPTTKVALPSAIFESKRAPLASRVGYASLALPPDGAYRPLRSARYGGDTYDSYSNYTGSSNGVSCSATEQNQLEPLPPLSVTSHYLETKQGIVGKGEETKRKSRRSSYTEEDKKTLAIKADDGCIGFANLPDQIHRKAIKRGFDFTLMIVGESGLGKSTLISSMFFQDDFYKDRIIPGAKEKISSTVGIQKRQLEIEEAGVRLRMTIVDTPGFNDAVNATDCWKPVNKYIQDQFEQYLKDESGLNRQTIQDNRVHCCLYFISPYGRGLRPIDVDFIKRLHNRVNIVPIIAKADVCTCSELKQLKAKVMEEIRSHKLQVYELPPTDNDEDEDFKRKDKELKDAYPFAVIGGDTVIEVDGKEVTGRVYPWGIVEAENPEFSDVKLLRQFLVSTHLHDLKEATKDAHYENFRAGVIDQKAKTLPPTSSKIDAERLLKEKEEEIRRMHMMLQKMQSQMQSSYAR